jgi:hypothetical protein
MAHHLPGRTPRLESFAVTEVVTETQDKETTVVTRWGLTRSDSHQTIDILGPSILENQKVFPVKICALSEDCGVERDMEIDLAFRVLSAE